MNSHINSASNQNSKITASAFSAKFKSKREVYLLLSLDVRAYLPSFTTVTIYFLKDLVSGAKKCKSHLDPLTSL